MLLIFTIIISRPGEGGNNPATLAAGFDDSGMFNMKSFDCYSIVTAI